MMSPMIKENGVTFKELEKKILHGSARLGDSLPGSFWKDMTGC